MDWSAFNSASPRWKPYVMKINHYLTAHTDTFSVELYTKEDTVNRVNTFLSTVTTRSGALSLSSKKCYLSALSTYLQIANINSNPYKSLISKLAQEIRQAQPAVVKVECSVTPQDLEYAIKSDKVNYHIKLMSAILLYGCRKQLRLVDVCATRHDVNNGKDHYLDTTTGVWTLYNKFNALPIRLTICKDLLNLINIGKGPCWITGNKIIATNSISMLFKNMYKHSYLSVAKMLDPTSSDESSDTVIPVPETMVVETARLLTWNGEVSIPEVEETMDSVPDTVDTIPDASDKFKITLKPQHYIYLLQEREFIKTEEFVYKIGRTHQESTKRFKSYSKGSVLHIQLSCSDCVKAEKDLLVIFRTQFTPRTDIGSEYFEGNVKKMSDIIYGYINK